MKITNFNSYNLHELMNYIKADINTNPYTYTEKQLRDMLSPISITFSLENINRLQSTLLCEQKFSYVQQSQRYVSVSKGIIPIVPENMPKDLYHDGIGILDSAIRLYHQMTAIKEESIGKKRHTKDDFKYGIPYEDARYLLPLCVPTNIAVTISGDQLIDLYQLFYQYPIIMDDIRRELNKYIDNKLINSIMQFVYNTRVPTNNIYEFDMKQLYLDNLNHVSIIGHSSKGLYNAAYGALTSQNAKSPETIMTEWAEDETISKKERCTNLVKNVMSYGHKSIIEQMRNTSVMKCSLTAYHQVIRHRIQKIQRDNIFNLVRKDFKYYTPESIKNQTQFAKEYHNIMKMYSNLFDIYNKKYSDEYLSLFLPNSAYICFVINSNASHDNWIFRERLCQTAQTEIRELYDEKFRRLYYIAPEVYSQGLPPCAQGKGCKEGRMSCGHPEILQEKYNII